MTQLKTHRNQSEDSRELVIAVVSVIPIVDKMKVELMDMRLNVDCVH
jgi:hypothetical protein